MSKFNKSRLTLNRIFFIFIITTFLSFSFEQATTTPQTTKAETTTPQTTKAETITPQTTKAETTTPKTTKAETTTPHTTIVETTTSHTTIIETTLIESTNETEEIDGNSTLINSNIRTKKNSGLSAGSIIGIIVPCVAAVGGLGAAYALTRTSSPVVNQNIMPAHFESSMSKFNTQPNNIQTQVQPPVKEVEVIQSPPIVEQHPIYPVKQEAPIINNNIIPQPIDTVQPITSTNISIPIHNPMASQTQLIQNNNAIKIINNSQQISPQNNVSQTNPSLQVIPIMD